jgi:hypothetical protein
MNAGSLVWHREPPPLSPERPAVCVAGFDGWNDAGEAASRTVRRLAELWNATPLASIDPEDFVDFSTHRPLVERRAGERFIRWPAIDILLGASPSGQPMLFVVGPEPQLRWRTFCSILGDVLAAVGVELVVLLGALLTDVPHTRPTRITQTAGSQALADKYGFTMSRYEGPTGIVGVLADACRQFQIDSVSMWASVPHYLPGSQAPRAALSLIEAVGDFLDFPLSPLELHVEAAEFDRQINDVVESDEDMRRYVAQLEERFDSGDDDDDEEDDESDELDMADEAVLPADDIVVNGSLTDAAGAPLTGDALAAELEQFLRERDS